MSSHLLAATSYFKPGSVAYFRLIPDTLLLEPFPRHQIPYILNTNSSANSISKVLYSFSTIFMKTTLTTAFLVGLGFVILTAAIPMTNSLGTTTSVMDLKQYSKLYLTQAIIPFLIPHSRPYPTAAPKPTASSTAKSKGVRLTTVCRPPQLPPQELTKNQVRVCKNANLTACRDLTNTVNVCRPLTTEFGPTISSVIPGPDVICYLYQ